MALASGSVRMCVGTGHPNWLNVPKEQEVLEKKESEKPIEPQEPNGWQQSPAPFV